MYTEAEVRESPYPSLPSPAATLYAGPDLVVTWQWLLAHGHQYRIAELRGVVRTTGTWHPGTHAALFIATANLLLFVPAAVLAGSSTMLLGAATTVLVPCLVAGICQRLWPPRQELLAHHRGAAVRLYASRNEREFGQASRAVMRAIEAATQRLP